MSVITRPANTAGYPMGGGNVVFRPAGGVSAGGYGRPMQPTLQPSMAGVTARHVPPMTATRTMGPAIRSAYQAPVGSVLRASSSNGGVQPQVYRGPQQPMQYRTAGQTIAPQTLSGYGMQPVQRQGGYYTPQVANGRLMAPGNGRVMAPGNGRVMASPYMTPQYASPLARPTGLSASAQMVRRMPVSAIIGSNTTKSYEAKHKKCEDLSRLKVVRKKSGLGFTPVAEALNMFKASADQDGKLTREAFEVAYHEVLAQNNVAPPAEDVTAAVFDLVDRDDNGMVDMLELVSAMSLLCAGTEEDKIKAIFDSFDENGDGFISQDEMFKFLTSVFKVVLTQSVLGLVRSMGVDVDSPADLAMETTMECFRMADLNHDGRLSMAEFQTWFYGPSKAHHQMFNPLRAMLR